MQSDDTEKSIQTGLQSKTFHWVISAKFCHSSFFFPSSRFFLESLWVVWCNTNTRQRRRKSIIREAFMITWKQKDIQWKTWQNMFLGKKFRFDVLMNGVCRCWRVSTEDNHPFKCLNATEDGYFLIFIASLLLIGWRRRTAFGVFPKSPTPGVKACFGLCL